MRLHYGVVFLVSLITVGVKSHADDKAIRKNIASNYASISQAFKKSNIAVMTAFMTSDFRAARPDGQSLDRDQVEADFKQQRASFTSVDWHRKIEKLSVEGAEAVVTVSGSLVGTTSDGQGKHHKLLLVSTSRDTWVDTGIGWKIKASEVLVFHMTIDGKTVGRGAQGK